MFPYWEYLTPIETCHLLSWNCLRIKSPVSIKDDQCKWPRNSANNFSHIHYGHPGSSMYFFMLYWLLWNYTMKYAKDNSSPSILSLILTCLFYHTGLYKFYAKGQTMPIWTCVYCWQHVQLDTRVNITRLFTRFIQLIPIFHYFCKVAHFFPLLSSLKILCILWFCSLKTVII